MAKKLAAKEWPNVPFKTWKYEPHTEMKHRVLEYYLEPWSIIRSKYHRYLNYIDGFGGIGAYHTAEDLAKGKYVSNRYGSPIFSIKALMSQKMAGRIKGVNVLIIDSDQACIDNLKKILKHERIELEVDFICGDFDVEINKFLDQISKESKKLYPTFFLIDPFGFSIKMETIKRIMSFQNMEVVINFMYNSIQRFTKIKNLKKIYDDLFGCEDWQQYVDSDSYSKESALVRLFRNQCKTVAGVKFVYPFKLNFEQINKPYYYLFHLSNHHKACSLMKDVFAERNNGYLEYKGENNQASLFDLLSKDQRSDMCPQCYASATTNTANCGDCLLKRFSGQELTYEQVIINMIDVVPYTQQGITRILQSLEKNKKIKVQPSTTRKGKRKTGFKEADLLIFPKI